MFHIEEEFHSIEKQHGWNALFKKLETDHHLKALEKKTDIALLNINRELNRFRDVLPYDDTRVRLKRGSNDYINANYVRVPSANRKYILTQGPLPTTVSHFWQMIWEENSRVIVMLTHLIEKGCQKCWLYYPDYQTESELTFEDIDLKVTFVSERPYRHYTQRRFDLENLLTNECRPIIHWSDFDWPDHGAPNNPEPFLHLLNDVRHCGAFDSRYGAPILHCSAGIGRSGTFVLVDSILKIFAHSTNPGEISLIDILTHIRTQRHGLIQTPEQLRFSYVAIMAGLKMLNKIEESERPFVDCDFHLSSDSESDLDDERSCVHKKHPKECGRQDNIMPNGRLSETMEDINCELMRRVDSNASNSQLSPKTIRRLSSLSSDELKNASQSSTNDPETVLRLRQERLIRSEKIDEIKNRLHHQSSSSSVFPRKNEISLFHSLTTKYRRPLFFAIFTVFAGSFLFYKYVSSNSRHR